MLSKYYYIYVLRVTIEIQFQFLNKIRNLFTAVLKYETCNAGGNLLYIICAASDH